MIVEGRITDESIKSKLTVDEYGLFRDKNFCDTRGHQFSDICSGCESLDGVPVKYRKKTHYDEVRAMSVGEMADWLGNIVQEWFSGTAEVNGKTIDSWLEWLEEEVPE